MLVPIDLSGALHLPHQPHLHVLHTYYPPDGAPGSGSGVAAYPTGTGVPPQKPGILLTPSGVEGSGDGSSLAQYPTGCGYPPQKPGILFTPSGTEHSQALHTYYPPEGAPGSGVEGAGATTSLWSYPTGTGCPPLHPGAYPTGTGVPPLHPGVTGHPVFAAEGGVVLCASMDLEDKASMPHKQPFLEVLPQEREEAKHQAGQEVRVASVKSWVGLSDRAAELVHWDQTPRPATQQEVVISKKLYHKVQEYKKVNPGLGHASIIGTSILYGAFSATCQVANGEKEQKKWQEEFQKEATRACGACTPLGQYIMKEHLFAGKDQLFVDSNGNSYLPKDKEVTF